MNNEFATYTIGVMGFDRSERRALRRVVGMAEHRQPAFKPFEKEQGGCPHLVIVNADRASAIETWNRFRRANAHRASFSPIFVGRNPKDLPCPDPYVLHRPILTTSLFSVMDQAVTEVHGYRPARSVVDELVVLTQDELETTMETTTVLAPRGTGSSSDDHRRAGQATEFTALVVDDSFPVRVQMRGALSSIASRADFAETGERALQLIGIHAYSIVFLDVTLPDEDAYEICARIKKHPLQQGAVVVMLASHSSSAARVMGMLAGFDNYLIKPIQRSLFNDLAAQLMRPPAAI